MLPLVSHGEYAPRAVVMLEKRRDRQTDGRQTVTLRLPLDAASVMRTDPEGWRMPHPYQPPPSLSTHAYRQGVDISFTVCLFVCFFVYVRLRISPPRTNLAASNFARRFIGVHGRESSTFVNFAPQKPKIGRRIGLREH